MKTLLDEIKKLRVRVNKLYIYGAGLYGRHIFNILDDNKICVNGYLVTKIDSENNMVKNLPVYEFSKINHTSIGIIVGVNSRNKESIIENLKKANIPSENIIVGTELVENGDSRYSEMPAMEITTKIGCSIRCKYCPQDLLLKKYFENDINRKSILSSNDFEKCLNKLPKNATILFSGMAEPFLNKDCAEMIKIAADSRRRIELFTTTVGATLDDLKKIINIDFGYVALHLADKYGYANIPVTEEYLNKLRYLFNAKRQGVNPFVTMTNAQAEVDERVKQLLPKQYTVLTEMLDRAGNLSDECLLKKEIRQGKIECTTGGARLDRNVLLPDGTVILCNMDYGMQHVLGNLLYQTYDEIMSGSEINKIRFGLKNNESVLCRYCSCARVL